MPTQKLELAPLTPDDYTALISWVTDEKSQAVWAAKTFSYPLTREDLDDFIALCLADTPHREFMKAIDKDSGSMVGVFSLKRIDSMGHTGHLSMIMVSPETRGQGTGSAMVRAALSRGFDTKGFRRMQLYVFDFNTAAKKCYAACGMAHEGRGKMKMTYKGEEWKVEVMGISKNGGGR
ncbi:GNAT family protein [Desulfoluna sp.]|uniref:GNAT family N-acetyltransferase n=1 Tax=Desulfoluna sp. TaxID=2045199 RepID=UPI002615140D|nr:GNAT family protein [Desulfoluna sp.]